MINTLIDLYNLDERNDVESFYLVHEIFNNNTLYISSGQITPIHISIDLYSITKSIGEDGDGYISMFRSDLLKYIIEQRRKKLSNILRDTIC